MYILVCLIIVPASMALFGGFLFYMESTMRQTKIEEQRLRAELMAESAVAYYSAMSGDARGAGESDEPRVIAGPAYDGGATFRIVVGAKSEGRSPVVFRGSAIAKLGKTGSFRYVNEIGGVELAGGDLHITSVSREIAAIAD